MGKSPRRAKSITRRKFCGVALRLPRMSSSFWTKSFLRLVFDRRLGVSDVHDRPGERNLLHRRAEPLVMRRGMIYDQVHHDPDAERFRLRHEPVEILHRSELRIDRAVIVDVIAVVMVMRRINGREPDRVRAETFDIRQLLYDAAQVAYSVAVRILEGSGPDLVNDLVFEIVAHANSLLSVCSFIPGPFPLRSPG